MRNLMGSGIALIALVPVAASAEEPLFVDPSFDGMTMALVAPIGEELQPVDTYSESDFGANGGGGQTGGGVVGLMEGDLEFEIVINGNSALQVGPATVTMTTEGFAYFNTEKVNGIYWYGYFDANLTFQQTKLAIPESTCYYVRTSSPGMVNLIPADDDAEITDDFIAAGLYQFGTGVAIAAHHDPPQSSSPGPHYVDDYWQLVLAAPGDLTGSGSIDGVDLLALLAAWGECPDPADCIADLNGDGVVDVDDLFILLANWG